MMIETYTFGNGHELWLEIDMTPLATRMMCRVIEKKRELPKL